MSESNSEKETPIRQVSEPARPVDNRAATTLAYLLPFLSLAVVGVAVPAEPGPEFDLPEYRASYGVQMTWFVTIQSFVMAVAIVWGLRTVLKSFPLRCNWAWAIGTGVAGAVLWIGLCQLQWESRFVAILGLETWLPERPGFNPFIHSASTLTLAWFLVFRFFVLAVAVPIAEEWLIRGWLVRWWDTPHDWQHSGLKSASLAAMMAVLVYAVLTHPQEVVAALVWFSLINLLMKRTGNLWDCVVAHSVTNFLLGLFVLTTGQWRLW